MTLPKIILSNEGRILYNTKNHPIRTVKNMIEHFFKFENFDNLNYETSIKQNFDELLVPLSHPARSIKDTFYLNENYIKNFNFLFENYYIRLDTLNKFYKYYLSNKILNHDNIKLMRTHMTTHLPYLLKKNYRNVIYTGTVYRRDEIDKYHFPIFHQTDGFLMRSESFEVEADLKIKLEKLINYLFKSNKIEMKWEDNTSFPFTDPSYELYIKRENDKKWIEILGCGKIKKEVIYMSLYEKDIKKIIENEIYTFDKNLKSTLDNYPNNKILFQTKNKEECNSIINKFCNKQLNNQITLKINEFLKNINYQGWAFGIGLERLCMLLYGIEDIRLLWSNDKRFINQFKENEITKFYPFSNFPSIKKDISFYINDNFKENIFFQLCRDIAHENIEEVKKVDHYFNPKTNETSVCYRITYRSHNQNLTHKFVNNIQNKIIESLIKECSVHVR
ncbi:phenylalanine--tRNA ligase, putative [Plasmodium gallinaceum]|uniref:phenylalanine--tRNA ligase n=1 Tax=Plasmodium gallinaceum TaxID=5849 RepID=A0A1J1GMI9_PLAGA|nr:phenylalanine--tRNA ligase, putative [Plasmodium gallinaceum]CRG93617.1 phenylalanine--tRNA ligase, putative [Plasmodium gallinaceum]